MVHVVSRIPHLYALLIALILSSMNVAFLHANISPMVEKRKQLLLKKNSALNLRKEDS